MTWTGPLEGIDDYRWRIPKNYKSGMRVDGIIYARNGTPIASKQDAIFPFRARG